MQLKIGKKTYESAKITAGMTREALELNIEALELAYLGQQLQKTQQKDLTIVQDLSKRLLAVTDRRAELIRRVFGGQMTAQEILDGCTNEELNALILAISRG